jgi:RNA polymerase sigma factor (sigma-70 family)
MVTTMSDDAELLQRYARQRAEDAFTELVRRYLNLVWSAARRITGDGDQARDVAQTVFADLARKADRLPRGTVLAGWLHRAACLAAANLVRGNARRAARERQVMELNPLQAADPADARAAEALQPLLDAALNTLDQADRDAVVLRYLSGKSFAEVGAALGSTEAAAQRRISRAVEKLRAQVGRRGVATSAVGLTLALAVASAEAAPAGLAAVVSTASLAAASAAGTVGIAQTIMLMKTKLMLATIAVAAVATPIAIQQTSLGHLREENLSLKQTASQVAGLKTENERLANLQVDPGELARLRSEHAELIRLRGEVAGLRRQIAAGARLASSAPPALATAADPALAVPPDQFKQQSIDIANAMKQMGLAAKLFALDHNDVLPTTFDQMKAELPPQFGGGVTLDLFEFMPQSRPIAETEPEVILFRERTPRQAPNGNWVRHYALVDGSVQEATTTTPDSSAWEAPHLAAPAGKP